MEQGITEMERREVAGGEKTETGRLTKQAASFFFFNSAWKNKRKWSYKKLEKLLQIFFQKVQENNFHIKMSIKV